jgi:hypothetical protein
MATLTDQIKKLVPGTTAYEAEKSSEDFARKVVDEWNEGEEVYQQLADRITTNRDFYLGKNAQQFNSLTTEGNLRIPVNVGATVLDLITFILTNNPPTVQFTSESANKVDQVEASVKEDVLSRALQDADFKRRYRDSVKIYLLSGFCWWYPFWNRHRQFGQKRTHFDFTVLNPYTTRVKYRDTNYEEITSFITTKRMTQEAVYEDYGLAANADGENPWIPKEIAGESTNDDKVTVFNRYDIKYIHTVIDNRIADRRLHGFDFVPLIQTNNIWLLNEAHGRDEVERWLPVAQELNMLISAASEIARDLAWPPILEYNKALGGKKVPKWRGQKIPVRRSDKGESLEFMLNRSQVEPLLAQIRLLLDLFHFVTLMPKAASGIFDASVTSGFQAKLAMQPATLSGDNKKIDWETSVKTLAKSALFLIDKNQSDTFKMELPDGTELRFSDVTDHQLEVIWPDNLPLDIAREVQNLVMGIQNSLTSVTQSVDRYNALLGLGSPEDTKDYLEQEAENANLAPDRALKVAQVKQALSQVQEATASIGAQTARPPAESEETRRGRNATNLARGATGRLPEEQRAVPPTAREALPAESLGGAVLPPAPPGGAT